jgi:hypothetical protein
MSEMADYIRDLSMMQAKPQQLRPEKVHAAETDSNRARINGALADPFLGFRHGLSGMGSECDAKLFSTKNLG